MPRALISVSQDGYAYLSLDGATSRYTDTGQAMAYLGDYARATETPVTVTIGDGAQGVDVEIDVTGRIVPAQTTETELGATRSAAPEPTLGTTSARAALDEDLLHDLVLESYCLVVAKMPRRDRPVDPASFGGREA